MLVSSLPSLPSLSAEPSASLQSPSTYAGSAMVLSYSHSKSPLPNVEPKGTLSVALMNANLFAVGVGQSPACDASTLSPYE